MDPASKVKQILEAFGGKLSKIKKAEVPGEFEDVAGAINDILSTQFDEGGVRVTTSGMFGKKNNMTELPDKMASAGTFNNGNLPCWAEMSLTKSLGNYESAKFGCGASSEYDGSEEDYKTKIAHLKKMNGDQIKEFVSEIASHMKNKGTGE